MNTTILERQIGESISVEISESKEEPQGVFVEIFSPLNNTYFGLPDYAFKAFADAVAQAKEQMTDK